mgnify:CR=1 FL=1
MWKIAVKEQKLNEKKVKINSKYKPTIFEPNLNIYNYQYQFSCNPTLYLNSF